MGKIRFRTVLEAKVNEKLEDDVMLKVMEHQKEPTIYVYEEDDTPGGDSTDISEV